MKIAGIAKIALCAAAGVAGLWFGRTFLGSYANSAKVACRVAEIEKAKPRVGELARKTGGRLQILVFKKERVVEVHAPGWAGPRQYEMKGFSGGLGPKLREGDLQIPEGVYGIEHLNPNSLFHLSLRVSYPNAFDRARAVEDGRDNLGGDIMIHGGDATVGCIPIGDDAIEELFCFAATVGCKNVSVVIAPYDMRNGRDGELERSSLSWYGTLCDGICDALLAVPKTAP